jgi:hypothetical protein
MKNIFGTQETIKLYDENKVLRYNYRCGVLYECLYTYDSNGKELTYENSYGYSTKYTRDSEGNTMTFESSNGDWHRYTRDSDGKELTYENSYGTRRGFDIPEYTMEELTKIIGKEFKVKK